MYDPFTIYFLLSAEGSGMSFFSFKLNGENYEIWIKVVTDVFEGCNKFGFVNGDFLRSVNEKGYDFVYSMKS